MQLLNTIRINAKKSFDRIRNEHFKQNLLQAIPFWIASLVTGLIAVFFTRLFAWAEQVSFYFFHKAEWSIFITAPVCFLIAWLLVQQFAPNARGSGIPQVMASIELANPKYNYKIDTLLSIRIIIVKIASSIMMALGGGVIGREGPTIQIAGSVFRKINQWLPAWYPKISKRNMIMTGAAAGLAAAFNTPLGGIVFAVEELTKTHISYFKTALFTAVIIAGLTAQGLLGPYLYLGYPDIRNTTAYAFVGVVIVSVIAGVCGSLTAKCILALLAWKKTFARSAHHIMYVAGCGLVIALLACLFKNVALGSGKELMGTVLFSADKYSAWYVPFIRMGGSIVSFTTGASGGIFAPALSAGASIGSVIAGWFHLTAANSNVIILCGMVGFLTGIPGHLLLQPSWCWR